MIYLTEKDLNKAILKGLVKKEDVTVVEVDECDEYDHPCEECGGSGRVDNAYEPWDEKLEDCEDCDGLGTRRRLYDGLLVFEGYELEDEDFE
jgi:hypothetical protein